jgi:hypothetical protein
MKTLGRCQPNESDANMAFFITQLTRTSRLFRGSSPKRKKSFEVLVQLISSDGR